MTTNSHATDPPVRTHKDYYSALYHAALTISSSLETRPGIAEYYHEHHRGNAG